jgi:hypothetical protein
MLYIKTIQLGVNRSYVLDVFFVARHLWRMHKPDAERVLLVMPTSLVEAIEDYRYDSRVPSRSEAIRRLLAAGLEAERQRAAHSVPKPRRGAKPTA